MRHEVSIIQMTKKVERFNGKTNKNEMVDDDVFVMQKDVERYEKDGYKDVAVIRELKNFTPQQKKYYIDGDESAKRQKVVVSPEDTARKSFENDIANMTSDELQETANQYGLDLILSTIDGRAAKQRAVIEGIRAKDEKDIDADKAEKTEPAKKAAKKKAAKKADAEAAAETEGE